MSGKVVYVPLDERHCNYGYPYVLGKFSGMDIVRPPEEMMSRIKQPCDIESLWEWLYENVKDCDYAILSLDMLVYGCILSSRHHHMSVEESVARLNRLRKLREINSKVEIHAFNLIMRVANYDNNSEEPDYWEKYGTKIWKYSWLSDKDLKTGLDDNERNEFDELKGTIPSEYLSDYTDRRKVNLQVNLNALNLVEEDFIDYLVIPKDDTSEYGFSTRDQGIIYENIYKRGLQDRVLIYPGTDEVGCTLTARVFNRTRGFVPKVCVYYSSTIGPSIIASYEDRPINESIKWQLLSAGCMMVDSYKEADFILMVNTPGKYMMESYEQLKSDRTYINFRNLLEFVQKLKYFISCGKICVVADIAYANGADNELVQILMRERLLEKIAGYGGWNTAANTLGVVILQGVIASALRVRNIVDYPDFFSFHIQKIVKDWAYQSNVLWYIYGVLAVELGFDSYKLGEMKEKVAANIVVKLNEFIEKNLVKNLPVGNITVNSVKLAWDRVFDVEFDLNIKYL